MIDCRDARTISNVVTADLLRLDLQPWSIVQDWNSSQLYLISPPLVQQNFCRAG